MEPSTDDVEATVRAVSREDLIVSWRRAYGRSPPKGVSRALLEQAAAWTFQAKRNGGLTTIVRRKLARMSAVKDDDPAFTPKPGCHLGVGTRLARDWNGCTHVVDVTADGFRYGDITYGSLSAVARAITGARWSGPRFFGLDRKG